MNSYPETFIEDQYMWNNWVVKLVVGVLVCVATIPVVGITTGVMPVMGGIVILALQLLIVLIVGRSRLRVVYAPDRISYRFFHFQIKDRYIDKNSIQRISIGSYNPLKDYGGWGIRFSRAGVAYTVTGNEGIFILLSDGNQLLLGTQRAETLGAWLRSNGYPIN